MTTNLDKTLEKLERWTVPQLRQLADTIQAMLRGLIDKENPRSPLSDAKLAQLLKTDGIPVARRTVAKYREAMNIPSSTERQRL